MTYLLLIIVISILLICLYLDERDFFSPLFLSLTAFDMAFVFAFVGTLSWNNQFKISSELVLIFIVGILAFTLGSILAKNIYDDKIKKKTMRNKKITVENWKIVIASTFIIITIVLMILEIKKVCAYFGFHSNNISDLLSYYRSKGVLYSNEISRNTVDINFIVKQMHKTCLVIGVLFIYAFCNNNQFKKNNYYYLIPVGFSMIESLLTSGRSLFMRLILISFFCYLYFKLKKLKKLDLKTILYGGGVIIGVLVLFYVMLPLLGRNTNVGFIKYITFYFSCGIPSFNIFLLDVPEHVGYLGEETFTGLYLLLNKFNIVDFTRIANYSWVSIGGMNSNIYTSLKAYYFDFGSLGVMLLQFIFGFVSTFYYNYSKNSKKTILFVIYFYFIYIFIEQIRAEQFFGLISSTTISNLLIIMVMYYFLYKFNKKSNKVLIKRIKKFMKL